MLIKTVYFALFLLPFSLFAQGGIVVDNGRLFFKGVEGETLYKDLTISNPTDAPLNLQVLYADWKRDSLGVKQYDVPGAMSHSCAEWLSVNPQVITVSANDKTTVSVRMEVPEDYKEESGVRNAMIFLRQVKNTESRKVVTDRVESDVKILFQLGVHAYFSPISLEKRAIAVRSMVKDTEGNIRVGIENTGETLLTASVQLELTDLAIGQELIVSEKPLLVPFMPGDFRYVNLVLPSKLPKSKYSALAIVDIGVDSDLEIGMLEFEETSNLSKDVAVESN